MMINSAPSFKPKRTQEQSTTAWHASSWLHGLQATHNLSPEGCKYNSDLNEIALTEFVENGDIESWANH
jgi:hypothetical protein